MRQQYIPQSLADIRVGDEIVSEAPAFPGQRIVVAVTAESLSYTQHISRGTVTNHVHSIDRLREISYFVCLLRAIPDSIRLPDGI